MFSWFRQVFTLPQLTPSQQEAIYTQDCNLIVVAGAGSGKTFVLVERYLALLDSHPEWRLNQLVAITFTQKAAQEMRDRVREALQQRLYSAGDDESITLWSQRLAAMDSARIDTIHALCASILRANAAEAGIDPGFEVLDEVEAQLLLETSVDDALRGLAAEASPAMALFREYEPRPVRELLADFASADLPALPADLMAAWTAAWQINAESSLQALYADPVFEIATNWQPVGGFPAAADKLYDIWQTCFDCLNRLRSSDDLMVHLDTLRQLSSEIRLNVGSQSAWGGIDTLKEAKAALKTIREEVRATLTAIGEPPGDHDRRAAELLPHWLTTVKRVQAVYRRAKQERAALDFDDLERLTRDVLCDYAHVRERYCGREFRHILVDEFQDTNAVQWEIIQALAPPELPGALFVVGDPKQSIYAFRGADVSVFEQVRAQIGSRSGREIPLMRSFRTHEVLVQGFNQTFARIFVRNERSPARAYQTQLDTPMEAFRPTPPCDLPALEVILLDKAQLQDEENRADKVRRWEARALANRLRALVEDGRPVHDKKTRADQPVNYGDIAILFQSMTRVTLYEDVLKDAGLPFVTVAGRGYYNRQEVWDMLNLLRALHNPADALSLTAALRSPLFSLSDDALLALRLLANDQPTTSSLWLWQTLDAENPWLPADEAPRARFAAACLNDLRRLAGRVTIWELLSEALARTGYLATLTSLPDGARRRGNVEKLLEKAQSSGKITLGAFSQYLKDLSDREIHEGEAALEGEGAIKLMTVHKSKGLEFPVVVLADASWERGARGGGTLLVQDGENGLACKVYDSEQNKYVGTFAYNRAEALRKAREEAERRRLLYVAATRTQDLLIVSGQVDTKSSPYKASGWLDWLVDALDIGELEPLEQQSRSRDWGVVDVAFPALPDEDSPAAVERRPRPETVEQREPNRGMTPPAPPLMAAVPYQADAPARSMSATQIANLGGAIYADETNRAAFIQRWKRQVLHGAPARIEPVIPSRDGVSPSKIGDIVHKALRWWQPSMDSDDLRQRLDAYAWEEGIIGDETRAAAVRLASQMMQKVLASDVYQWIRTADPVYTELPFVFQAEQRQVQGVIDVLMRRADGVWTLLDYKTSFVASQPTMTALAEHAQRYHLQVGVYATAARELLGIDDIEVYIHYIRHGQTVKIMADAWQSALDRLEDHIGSLLGMDGI